jgi:Holliday junction DNA helicase RuvB
VPAPPAAPVPVPVTATTRTSNPLRPARLADLIGQPRMKKLLRRVIDASEARGVPLDHVLLIGSAGQGKSTIAHVIAAELGTDCYQLQAPVSADQLMALRTTMRDFDVFYVDEIHQQAVADRRGRSAQTDPEVLYHVLEDRKLVTPTGVLDFPHVTVIGATTDEGMLPDSFLDRFPLRPTLEPYAQTDLSKIARYNADALGVGITFEAAVAFARAARGVPRQINNYVRNGALLADKIDVDVAEEVVRDINRTTDDGLSYDMQRALVFLYRRGRRKTRAGAVTYQASVATLATALGKARDTKAVVLRVEPYLIERGYLQVGHGGRSLTDAGVTRAKELSKQGVRNP